MSARLQFERVGKTFPGVVALDEVGFAVDAGEIRGLMGENGAGKSTLLKILSGQYPPDSGRLLIDGADARFGSPRDSADAGIAIIHQELQLAPNLTVAENLMLGALPSNSGFVDRAAMRDKARAVLDRLGEAIDPDARVGDLPIGKRQMIEIGRALLRNARIIAFDEPTSSLSARETETLMTIIRGLRDEGCAILYVSHRMEEVFALVDSVTVLRDGRHVGDWRDMKAVGEDTIVAAMAGRTISDIYAYRSRPAGDTVLAVRGFEGPGLTAPVDLDVRAGEIVGFFGLIGAGRSELFKLLYGAVPASAGTIEVRGQAMDLRSPRDAIAAGMALCPEDRKDEGIVPLAGVRENIAIARRNLGTAPATIRPQAERSDAREMVETMRIKTATTETAIGTLSGGNQQKAIIARWLAAGADILLFDEPTRGIDVGARSEIYGHMYRLAEDGSAILFASSDLPEVIGVADRIVVMREGAIAAVVDRAEATPDRLLKLALPDRSAAA